jgi:hypothetical protein
MPDSNSRNGDVLTQVIKKLRSGEKVAPSEFQDFVTQVRLALFTLRYAGPMPAA